MSWSPAGRRSRRAWRSWIDGAHIDADAAEFAILELLACRKPGASICPSEAARRLDADDWRPRMDDVRAAAARLRAAGRVVVTQGGEPVDPAAARGPVRYRLP